MLNLDKPLKLPPQLHWKFAHEPELLGWTITARNYDLFWANAMFIFMITVSTIIGYFIYSICDDLTFPWRLIPSIIAVTILLSATMLGSHRRVNFAYRFTKSGMEYCQWKDLPKWVLALLKWLTALIFVVFLFLATLDISFLLGAMIGPGGMLLTYLSIAHDKDRQKLDSEYYHITLEWSDFKGLVIATDRDVVNLIYSKPEEGSDYIKTWSEHIFCKRRQKEHIANILKQYLAPDLPITRAKADIW